MKLSMKLYVMQTRELFKKSNIKIDDKTINRIAIKEWGKKKKTPIQLIESYKKEIKILPTRPKLELEVLKRPSQKTTKKLKLDNIGSLSINQMRNNSIPAVIPCDFSRAVNITPREIQYDILKGELYPRYSKGERDFVVSAPAGSGKTILGIMIAKAFLKANPNGYFLFCVHLKSLLEQTKQEFEELLGLKVGIIQGDTKLNLECQIQISMIQTLGNRLTSKDEFTKNLFNNLKIQTLIIDECHLSFKATEAVILHVRETNKDNKYVIIGLSGTPYSTFLAKLYGKESIIKVSTMREQMEKGVIVDYILKFFEEKIDTSKLTKNNSGEFTDKSVSDALGALIIEADFAEKWWKDDQAAGKYTLCFCKSIKDAEGIYEYWTEWAEKTGNICPSRIAIMHSKLSDVETSKIRQSAKNGEMLILVSVGQIAIGFDAPHFSVRLNFRPYAKHSYLESVPQAMAMFVQTAARTARSYNGGERAISLENGESLMIPKSKKGWSAAVDISTGKTVLFEDSTVINKDTHKEYNYKVVETLPKKDFAVWHDYTGIQEFISPQEIDEMFTELQQPKAPKELKDLKTLAEEELMKKLLNNSKKLPPKKISCSQCGTAHTPPSCPVCRHTAESVMSDLIEGVEIVFKNGEQYIGHMPEGLKGKLEKFKRKTEEKRKNVNWSKLTPDQKIKAMAGVMITIADDNLSSHANFTKILSARYHSVVSNDQQETSGSAYYKLKRNAADHVDEMYADLKVGNSEKYVELKKYIARVPRRRRAKK